MQFHLSLTKKYRYITHLLNNTNNILKSEIAIVYSIQFSHLKNELSNIRNNISSNSYLNITSEILNWTGLEESYRYGFNGKEHDKDFNSATGAIYDYGFRIYDSRIAKFLSVDPLTGSYPWYTPYQFAGNKQIWAIDMDGLEEWLTNNGTGNVLIVPGGEKTWNYQKINDLNNENFDVLKCETLEQVNQALDLYNKGSYKNVVLAQHGSTKSVNLSAIEDGIMTSAALDILAKGYDLKSKVRQTEFKALLMITSKIEPGGTFTFRHCLIAHPLKMVKKTKLIQYGDLLILC